MYRLVHLGILGPLLGLAQQVEILQGPAECDRPAGHHALLHLPGTDGDEQEHHRAVPEREEGGADLPDHEDLEDPEAGPPLHGAAVSGLHAAEELQGAGAAAHVLGHLHPALLQPGLLRREGRARDQVQEHPGDVLVGRHHHDDGRLRGYLPQDSARQDRGWCVLYMRRAGYRAAHPHHRQQFCRVLQGPDAAREGLQASRGAGEGQAHGQHRVLPLHQPEGRLRPQRGPHGGALAPPQAWGPPPSPRGRGRAWGPEL